MERYVPTLHDTSLGSEKVNSTVTKSVLSRVPSHDFAVTVGSELQDVGGVTERNTERRRWNCIITEDNE